MSQSMVCSAITLAEEVELVTVTVTAAAITEEDELVTAGGGDGVGDGVVNRGRGGAGNGGCENRGGGNSGGNCGGDGASNVSGESEKSDHGQCGHLRAARQKRTNTRARGLEVKSSIAPQRLVTSERTGWSRVNVLVPQLFIVSTLGYQRKALLTEVKSSIATQWLVTSERTC